MTTISIFCIGTSHDQREDYNILKVLHSLTVATGNDKKIIFDGADLSPGPAAEHLNEVTDQAIAEIKSAGRPAANSKIKVNLVGHSRGAANCLMIASHLLKVDNPSDYICNLFLIDTVKYAPKIPEKDVRFIYSNVNELVHIVMEDNTLFLFDLYEIKKDKNDPAIGNVRNIRIPGRHGTATQCNTIIPVGDVLETPTGYLSTNLEIEKLWPIGGLTLSLALQQLKAWGTQLDQRGEMLATEDWSLYFYHRIQAVNPIISRMPKKRWVNDTDRSSAGQPQKSAKAPGAIMRRTELLKLRRFGKNPFRFNPIFINEHHVQLCRQKHGDNLIDAVIKAQQLGRTISKKFGLLAAVDELTKSAPDSERERIIQSVKDAIKACFTNDYPFMQRLHAEGFVWNQDQILYDLL